MSVNELNAKVAELRSLKAMADELKDEISTIEDEIKAHMGDSEEIRVGDFKVRYTKVESSRFDTTAFKKTHSELYEQYCKTSMTRRFSIA